MDNISLDLWQAFSKTFLLPIAFTTRGRPCRIQGRVFIKPVDSTLFRLPSPFFGDLDKLVGIPASLPETPNVLTAAFADFRPLLKVYTNEEIEDIICIIIKAKPAAAKNHYKRSLNARFPDIYEGDNYMVYYNFY